MVNTKTRSFKALAMMVGYMRAIDIIRWLQDEPAWWVARHLPDKVVYFAVILAWAKATGGPWSSDDATAIKVDTVLQRVYPSRKRQ